MAAIPAIGTLGQQKSSGGHPRAGASQANVTDWEIGDYCPVRPGRSTFSASTERGLSVWDHLSGCSATRESGVR